MSNGHVLIVEDEKDIRELMLMHLTRAGYQTTAVEDGEKGQNIFKQGEFQLAVLDWMLPGISGLELCKKFAGSVPILMVTARANAADIVAGLEAGADDYITKPFEISVLLARVRALMRRAQTATGKKNNEWYNIAELKLNLAEHKLWRRDEEIKLTLSEFRLLVALLDNRGRVLSRDRLIEMVQGADVTVTDRTIDTHVFGLRKKLGDQAEIIETIRGVGYRVSAE